MKDKASYSDLRSPGILGRKPIIGLLMFVIGSLIFIILAYNLVNHGPLIKWDLPIAESFHALALKSSPFVIDVMIAGYYIGIWGIWVVGILLTLYFIYKRFWREMVITIVSLLGGGALFPDLSSNFMRPRPFLLFDKLISSVSPNIPGFPSGHAISIVVCSGLFIYLFVPRIKSYLGKISLVLTALLAILFIGFSRLYVCDHYLTDIIAGYAVGIAWFGLSITFIELLFQVYHLRKEKRRLG